MLVKVMVDLVIGDVTMKVYFCKQGISKYERKAINTHPKYTHLYTTCRTKRRYKLWSINA